MPSDRADTVPGGPAELSDRRDSSHLHTVPRRLRRDFTTWILLAATYTLAGKLGLALALVSPSATAVWPPSGIALAAFLVFGPRVWPGIFLGAFLTNELTAGTMATSLLIAAGNTLEALVGGYLVKRFAGGRSAFDHGRSIFLFVLLAGFVSTSVSATIGVTTLSLFGFGEWPAYWPIWLTWWLGDASGAMVVTPALLFWNANPRVRWSRGKSVELFTLVVLLVVVGWTVFVVSGYPLGFLCIPICLWAACRFGQREAATATCLLSSIAVWGSIQGLGTFASHSINEALLLLQAFLAVTSIIGITVGAAVSGRRIAEERLRGANEDLELRVRARANELQSAVDKLMASEARLAEAQEVAHVGSWEWKVPEKQLWWSNELYRMFGLDRASYRPSYEAFLDLVHPDDREGVDRSVQQCLKDGQPFEFERRMFRGDGAVRIIHSQGRIINGEDGRGTRMLGTAQDITERKHLEDQRRQGQKMEAVGLLAGGIAHDFNNLLTVISGHTELVLDTVDDTDPRRADLLDVRKAGERAATLTRQLLAFSRRQVLQTRVLDLNALVADIHKLLRRTILEHIELVLNLDPALENVRADPGQLEQVVLNLAVNAGDAMPLGGQLRFATKVVDVDTMWARRHPPITPGRYVRLTVSDTGIGMSPETQSRIFEPFFTTKERGKGTGLGLATVYGIVKQSGGFIWARSQLQRGTTFEIYLPAVQDAVESALPAAPTAEPVRGSETILLAEDDGAVRRLARNVLQKYGYTVLEARDGDEALAIAQRYESEIDILVTDVVMPGLSGRHLADQLSLIRPGIRVLYSSGYSENITAGAGLARGLPLLAKPYPPVGLLYKIREILDAKPDRRQLV